MNPLKRKPLPAWANGSAASSPRPGVSAGEVKTEQDASDLKRPRYGHTTSNLSVGPSSASSRMPSSSALYESAPDPRVVALDLRDHLKTRGTMPYRDAIFYVQDQNPGVNAVQVLELFKDLERVQFTETNQVYTYIPELTITSQSQLLSQIRLHTKPTEPVDIKLLRDAVPVTDMLYEWLVNLERAGEILIVRNLGPFKDMELPRLGRKNGVGLGIMDPAAGKSAGSRFRAVFLDEVKPQGRGGSRVDDDFVHLWADVKILETDDVVKLLAEHDLSAGAAAPDAPKPAAQATGKKKKKTTRALKITNTHMKQFGVDFSKDYEHPA